MKNIKHILLLAIIFISKGGFSALAQVSANGKVSFAKPGDTIEVYLLDRYTRVNGAGDVYKVVVDKDSVFRFSLKQFDHPQLFRIIHPTVFSDTNDTGGYHSSRLILKPCILVPGDSVFIKGNYKYSETKLTGTGANRIMAAEAILRREAIEQPAFSKIPAGNAYSNALANFAILQNNYRLKDQVLDSLKGGLSKIDYEVLKIDNRYFYLQAALGVVLGELVNRKKTTTTQAHEDSIIQLYYAKIEPKIFSSPVYSGLLANINFREYAISAVRLENFEEDRVGNRIGFGRVAAKIQQKFDHTIGEPLMIWLYDKFKYGVVDYPEFEKIALEYFKNEDFRDYIRNIYSVAKPFNFSLDTLATKEGQLTDLSRYKNKIVVMDFWFTGCHGCSDLAPKLVEVQNYFKDNLNVAFISISVDKKKQEWERSIKEAKYTLKNADHYRVVDVNHSIVSRFQISAYPTLIIAGGPGNSIINPQDKNFADAINLLITAIKSKLSN